MAYSAQMNENTLLKFVTCGSVDDGKSTLIGHMLYDAKLLFTDQEQTLLLESRTGSANGGIDYSLLLDGLMAEREQGITIDVAYRYFSTEKRSFIVADAPGHEEYTRNMAVGASFADLALILVDSSKGVLNQTRRHARICSMMGIRDFVFAINKMDITGYDQERFLSLKREIEEQISVFRVHSLMIIPVSATQGDNITSPSQVMTWYHGPALLPWLEEVEVYRPEDTGSFCMPVQRICRPDRTFRGIEGQIREGSVSTGDELEVLPGGEKARVKSLLVAGSPAETAQSGQPVTVCLDREIDASRGEVLVKSGTCLVGDAFDAELLWMDDVPLSEGKNYYLKLATKTIPATLEKIHYKMDIHDGRKLPADRLYKNEIASVTLIASEPIVFDLFEKNRSLGSFILIDRVTNMTSACGTVSALVDRKRELFRQNFSVTRAFRSGQKGQRPLTLWFTGLSGSGKSTLANEVEQRLALQGRHTMTLDGDNLRLGLNKDLGFSEEDRGENIRRVAEVAKLMNDAGLIVLTAFISPYAADRSLAKEIIGEDSFLEVYVKASLETCEERDVKGLYRKARTGEIPDFTGITSPYEAPDHPDLTVDTQELSIEEGAERILSLVQEKIRDLAGESK